MVEPTDSGTATAELVELEAGRGTTSFYATSRTTTVTASAASC